VVLSADFDGDAIPDAVALDSHRLQVLLNPGDGSLSAPITTELQASALDISGLIAAPIDADDFADILYQDQSSGSSFLRRGVGDGTFLPGTLVPTLSGYGGLHGVDINGDGDIDLLASKSGALGVFLGNGDGTFALPVDHPSQGFPGMRAVAEMTGDTNLDAVVAISEGFSGITGIAVFPGNGDGTFDAQVVSDVMSFFGTAAAGDFDGDGDTDITAWSSSGLRFFEGNGTGALIEREEFQASVSFGAQTILALDIDGDGDDELAYVESIFSSSGFVHVLQRSAEFVPYRSYPAGRTPAGMALADFDQDGRLDILASASEDGEVVLLGSDGFGNFRSPYLLRDHPGHRLGQGDFDHDGRTDIATRYFRTAGVLMPRPGRTWESFFRVEPNDWLELPLMVEDFDLDGNLDFATNHPFSLLPAIFHGNGDGTLDPPQQIDPFYQIVGLASGHWNLDGRPDLATVVYVGNSPQLHLRLAQTDGTFLLTPLPLPGDPQGVSSLDADGDGLDDLLIDGANNDWIAWGRGDGTFGPILTMAAGFSMTEAAVADLDNDGHRDLIRTPSSHIGTLEIFYGLGGRLFEPGSYLGLPWPAAAVESGDVDGDGNADILALGNALAHFRGLGNRTFFQPDLYPGVVGGDLELVDFNGTGVLDVVTSGVTVLHNRRLAARVDAEAACAGRPVRLEALVTGVGPWVIQWRKDGMDLSDGGNISGATSQILTIDPASAADDGSYDVVVTDLCTNVMAPPVTVTVGQPPGPSISAPASVASDTAGLTASVPNVPGQTFLWNLTGGTITEGQGTSQITFTSGDPGTTMTLEVVAEATNGCQTEATADISVDYLDVAASDPFREFINTITRNGVTAGCGGGNYCPDQLVTRAQMAIFLLVSKNGAAYTPPPATGLVFLDVPANAFAAAFIEALFAAQVTSGCGGGNYCPDFFITRAEMAVFLLRMLEGPTYNPPPATGTVFGDVGINDFAAAWIEEIADRGITGGCGGGNYCPNAFVSRAHMAVFLVTTFELE
jgi:hypothetical protein